ncbi:hypothetical protein J8J27_32625, partial [Mycobacterium tuberculosis]|nr:hypothetical protein [Mycobacterium tuberculosis]
GWTLTHELAFYLVVAAALAAGWQRRLTGTMAAVAAAAFVLAAAGTSLAYGYVASPFALEFLSGLLVYRLRPTLAAVRCGGTI